MGFLDKFGRGVEDVAGRAKSRFSNDVEPIEIASKLRETMDKRAASFARDRSVVPNVFRIHLAPADFQPLLLAGGAHQQFDMIPLNLLADGGSAAYIDSGVWADKALKEAERVGQAQAIWSGRDGGCCDGRRPGAPSSSIPQPTRAARRHAPR